MKKWIAAVLGIVLAAPGLPARVEGTQVQYVGGTVHNLKEGIIGKLDTQKSDNLVFEWGEGKLEIPYSSIRSFEYSERLARRMGALPTIAVVLVKRRQRRHFVEITFRDSEATPQVAVLEVPKAMVVSVVAVLETRAPKMCPTFNGSPRPAENSSPRAENACRVRHTAFVPQS